MLVIWNTSPTPSSIAPRSAVYPHLLYLRTGRLQGRTFGKERNSRNRNVRKSVKLTEQTELAYTEQWSKHIRNSVKLTEYVRTEQLEEAYTEQTVLTL